MKTVLLITDGLVHPPFTARRVLRNSLAELSSFEFQQINSLEKLPANMHEFGALVIYVHHKNISEKSLAALDEYVANGGGILGVHSATASFKKQSKYFEILGGRFIDHGPVTTFDVEPVIDSELFPNFPAFSIRDELYIHELQPGIRPHFTSTHKGQVIPIVWTYQYGEGRVCYAVPGHTMNSLKHPSVRKILKIGLKWVCQ